MFFLFPRYSNLLLIFLVMLKNDLLRRIKLISKLTMLPAKHVVENLFQTLVWNIKIQHIYNRQKFTVCFNSMASWIPVSNCIPFTSLSKVVLRFFECANAVLNKCPSFLYGCPLAGIWFFVGLFYDLQNDRM